MKLRDYTVGQTDYALQRVARSLGVAVGLEQRVIKTYRELRPSLRKAALFAMKQGASRLC